MPLYVRTLPDLEQGNADANAAAPYSDDDLRDLLFGLGMGASGGGGGYLIGQALVDAIIREVPPFKRVLLPISQALPSDFAVMAGGIGAPSAITPVTITKFADYAWAAIQAYGQSQKVTVNALLPVEAGPVNALLAMYLGWTRGLKVFDCDGAGRAVPSLTNLVFGYNDYPIAPVFLAGEKGGQPVVGQVLPPPADAEAAEAAIRDNLPTYGNAAGLVCWGQTGSQLRASTYVIAGQFEVLRVFGGKLRAASGNLRYMALVLNSETELVDSWFWTQLSQIKTDPRPGYDDGTLIFGAGAGPEATLQIAYENENMIARYGDGRIFTAPSGISMMFQLNGNLVPLNNGDNLPQAVPLGSTTFVVILKERCVLYQNPVVASFQKVLAGDPFDYTGPIQPIGCIP